MNSLPLIFLDTEFSSLAEVRPRLISVGMITEDDREFYAELPRKSWESQASVFVLTHVVPHLEGGQKVMPWCQLTKTMLHWLKAIGPAILVTDAPEYDFALIQPILEDEWPPVRPWNPFRFNTSTVGPQHVETYLENRCPSSDPTASQHHALADAKTLRSAWRAVSSQGYRPEFSKAGVRL